MSKTIDEKIVQIRFDNDKFQENVDQTIKSLNKISESVESLEATAKSFDMGSLTKAIDNTKVRWSLMQGVLTGFSHKIGASLFDMAAKAIKALNPMNKLNNVLRTSLNLAKDKGWSRAANIENAKFQLEGLNIAWETVSKQIDTAVSGTAYGLDSCAKAAAQLSASGVKIGENFKTSAVDANESADEMERALGAISGIAAMSNSTYDEIADIFTAAAGRGKVTADTFNRIAVRGINAAAELAKQMGITEAEVKDMASKGKISFQEFADAMYNAYFAQAKKSNDTFDGALANMKTALGKIGAEFAAPIREGLVVPMNMVRIAINGVKKNMDGLFVYFRYVIKAASATFAKLFGLDDTIKDQTERYNAFSKKMVESFSFVKDICAGLVNIFETLMTVLKPVIAAIRNLMPPDILQSIKDAAREFKYWTNTLKPSEETLTKIYKVIYTIGWALKSLITIIKNVFNMISNSESAQNFIKITATLILLPLMFAKIKAGALGLVAVFPKLLTSVGKLAVLLGASGGLTAAIPFAISAFNALMKTISDGGGLKVWFKDGVNTVLGYTNGLKAGASTLFQNGVEIFKRFVQAVESFLGIASPSKLFAKIAEFCVLGFGVGFKKAAVSLKNIVTSGIVDHVIKPIQDGFNKISNLSFDGFKNGLKSIGEKVVEYVKKIDYGKIATIGFILVLFKLVVAIKKITTGILSTLTMFEGIAKSVTGVMNSVSGLLGSAKRSIDIFNNGLEKLAGKVDVIGKQKTTITDIANALLKFAGAIAIVTGCLLLLSYIPYERLVQGGKALGILAAGFLGMTVILLAAGKLFGTFTSTVSKSADGVETTKINDVGKVLMKMAKAMLIFAAAVVVMTLAFNTLKVAGGAEGIKEAALKLGVMAVMMAELGAIAVVLSKAAPQLTKGSLFLLTFALSVRLLAKAFDAMPNMTKALEDLALLAVGIFAISQFLGAGLTSFAVVMKSFGAMVLEIAASALLIAFAFKMFTKLTPEQISNAAGILTDLMIVLTLYTAVALIITKQLGKELPKMGGFLVASAVAIGLLSVIVKSLSKLSPDEIFKGGTALLGIGAILMGLMWASQYTEKAHPVKFAASLALMTGCIGILAALVAVIGLIKPNQLLKGVIIVGALMALIGGLMFVSKYTEKANMKSIIATLISVEVLFATMILLSLVKDWTGIANAITAMGVIMVAFGAALALIGKYSFKVTNIIAMVVMAGVMLELGGILYALSDKPWESIAASGIAMTVALLTMADLLSVISSKTGLKAKKMGSFLLATLALIPIAAALWALSNAADWAKLIAGSVAIGIVLRSYADLMTTISSSSGIKVNKIGDFLLATLAVLPLAVGLSMLSHFQWGSILASGIAMGVVLKQLTSTLELLSASKGITKSKVDNFIRSSIALIPLGLSLAILSRFNFDSILASAIAFVPVMMLFKQILETLSIVSLKKANVDNFVKASLALLPIGASLAMVAGFQWNNILGAAAGLSSCILALAGALAVVSATSKNSALAAGSLLAVSVGLIAIAGALVLMSDVNWSTIGGAIAVLGTITVALAALGMIGPVVAAASLAIVAVSAALLIMAGAMLVASVAMEKFTPSLVILSGLDLTKLGGSLMVLAVGLTALGLACSVMTLGIAGMMAGAVLLVPFANGLMALQAVQDLSTAAASILKIGAACAVIGALSPAVIAGSGALVVLAAAFNILAPAVTKFAVSISAAVVIIQTSMQKLSNTMTTEGSKIGVNTIKGMYDGIVKNMPSIVKAGGSLATSLINSVKSKLGIHSPSKIMQFLGKMCGVGFSEGSTDADVWNGIKSKWGKAISTNLLTPAKNASTQLKGWFSDLSGKVTLLDNLTDGIGSLTEGFDNFLGEGFDVTSMLGDFDNITEEIENGLPDFEAGLAGVTDGLGGAGGAAGKAKDAFSELRDTIKGQIDIFSEFSAKTEMTADTILKNMRSQIDGVTNWANMMSTLGERGIDEGLLQYLGNLGPQGYEYVNAFVNMTAEQLEQAGALYQQSLTLPDSAAQQVLGSYAEAGKWASEGFAQGISGVQASENAKQMAMDALTGLTETLEIHSPSKKTEEIGYYFTEGFAKNLTGNRKLFLLQACHQLAYGMLQKIKSVLTREEGQAIGMNFTAGLADGVGNSSVISKLTSACKSMAQKVIDATKSGLDEHSPSKAAYDMGKLFDVGLINGIKDYSDAVAKTSERMGDSAVEMMQNAISSVVDVMNSDMDLNPTITPVLDLSNVQNGVDDISSIFSKGVNVSSINASRASISTAKVTTPSTNDAAQGATFTFTQNNYSPKALSRAEIYRQTKNQFSQMKGLVQGV